MTGYVVEEGDKVTHGREGGAVGVVLGWNESKTYLRVRWDHLDGFIGLHRIGDLYRLPLPASAEGHAHG